MNNNQQAERDLYMTNSETNTNQNSNLAITARTILKKYYGYDSFRIGQEEAIDRIIKRKDTIVIMPTGGGKSVCYQIPALIFQGITLVISPLISLMKDQVDALKEVGIRATYLNSSLEYREIQERIDQIAKGNTKIVYIAPERLETNDMYRIMNQNKIDFIAIDEAHCVSQWGHDFRPSYVRIHEFISALEERPVLAALTATATKRVTEDIVTQLGLEAPKIFKTGFDRENLKFSVMKGVNKKNFIIDYTTRKKGQGGIVYCGTRKETEAIYKSLVKNKIKAGVYHAGLSNNERKANQEKFIFDEIDVIVATNAFGMGIDKSNVRYVIHHNMPENIEAYYQEAGRAGRDSEPSECILLFSAADVQLRRFLIDKSEDLDEERKRNKYKKLQLMTQYCHVTTCLRKYILEYFGEEQVEEYCDNCSNCNKDIVREDITIEAQKIFSCVARMNGRFGVTVVAEVLKGSKNKRVLSYGFEKLSTYGIMSDKTLLDIKEIINILLAEGYLYMTTDEYPVVKLDEKARPVLKGEEQVYRNVLESVKVEVKEELFERLRNIRREISLEENIPPYMIFNDKSLKEMSSKYPVNKYMMLNIKGVGENKYEKYGERFIDIIRAYVEENEITVNVLMTTDSGNGVVSKENGIKKEPTYKISYDLYQELGSFEAVAKVRNIKVLTVENHIFEAHRNGYYVNLDDLITEGFEAQIIQVVKQVGTERLRPIKDMLSEEVSYAAIKAVIIKHFPE
jgi:ATP-dependent DNA helicase RecQ